jgi:transcriptional regulator with XRE-family HTH domain
MQVDHAYTGRMARKSRVGRPFLRRRLAVTLARLRTERKMTADQAAEAADVSQSSVSRAENAAAAITMPVLKSLLDAYKAADKEAGTTLSNAERDSILDLARSLGNEMFWHSYHDVLPDWFQWYVDLELEARHLKGYDSNSINGLLQTAGYAEATFATYHPNEPPAAVARMVEMRLRRQERLIQGELHLAVVLEEAMLSRAIGGPAVLEEQVQHLRKAASYRNVSLQIMPTRAPVSTTGPFSIMDFPDAADPSVVYLEQETGGLYLEKPEDERTYSRVFDRLSAVALSPDDSIVFLDQHLAGLRDRRLGVNA